MSYQSPPSIGCAEKRYPFLDRDLVEFIFSIPADQLLRPGQRRSLMRRSLAGILPPEIAQRRTKGVAIRRYLLAFNSSWPELERAFQTPISSQLHYINKDIFYEKLISAKNGNTLNIVPLLRGLSLEFWLRHLVTQPKLHLSFTAGPVELRS